MINAVASSSSPIPASSPYFPPTSPDHKPLIDPTDPPRESSSSLSKQAAVTSTPEKAEATAISTTTAPAFPTPPPSVTPSQTQSSADSGNSPGKHFSPRLAVTAIVLVLMLFGAVAGFYLTQQNQDLRQQASEGASVSCPTPGAPSPGATRCNGSTREVSVNIQCNEEQAAQCTGVCDKFTWAAHGEQKWCDADNTYHTCPGGSTGECCGPNCNTAPPPDNSGLDPNVPRTPAQICSAKGGSETSDSSADPNCAAQGGASCNIGSTNFCCYGDGKDANGVVQRDGNCYNSARECPGPYTIQKYSCDGATGFCSTLVSTYTSDSKPGAEACTQFEIIGSDGIGCGGVAPSGGTAGCGGTGGPNPPPVVDPPPTTVTHRQPLGHHDTNSCEAITGWSCDQDALGESVVIHIYIGSATKNETHIGTVTANQPPNSDADRAEILRLCGGTNANRRFSWTIPEQYRTQTDKYLWAFAINVGPDGKPTHVDGSTTAMQNPPLTNTPKQIVACTTPPTPIGPMCTLITAHTVGANNAVSATVANPATFKLNDKIAFKCGGNAAATTANYTYQFRLLEKLANGNKQLVNNIDLNNAGSATSKPFTISQAKTYFAECRICQPVTTTPGGEAPDPICQDWYHTL